MCLSWNSWDLCSRNYLAKIVLVKIFRLDSKLGYVIRDFSNLTLFLVMSLNFTLLVNEFMFSG